MPNMRVAASIGGQSHFTDSDDSARRLELSGRRGKTKTDVDNQITFGKLAAIAGLQSIGMGIPTRRNQASHRSRTGSQRLRDVAERAIDSNNNRLSGMGGNQGNAEGQGNTEPC